MTVGMLTESARACVYMIIEWLIMKSVASESALLYAYRCIAVHIDLGCNYFAALCSELCINLVLCVEHFVCGCSILLSYVMLSWPSSSSSSSCLWTGRPPASVSRSQVKDSFVGEICSRVYFPSTRFACFYVAPAWSFSSFSLSSVRKCAQSGHSRRLNFVLFCSVVCVGWAPTEIFDGGRDTKPMSVVRRALPLVPSDHSYVQS